MSWDTTPRSLPRNSIWNFGYYKESASESGQYGSPGRIGGIPISTGNADLERRPSYAQRLQRAVDGILRATGAPKVNIVAHSMGGIVARAYIRWLGGDAKVHRLLTVGTPNHGVPNTADEPYLDVIRFQWEGFPDWMKYAEVEEIARDPRIGDYTQPQPSWWDRASYAYWLNRNDPTWGWVQYGTIAGTWHPYKHN